MQIDLTAAGSANFVDSEHATTFDISGNILIVPKYAPFYAKDLVVSVLQENGVTVTLTRDTDYILAAKWHDVGIVNGGVYSAIFITNKTLDGQWFLRYRALGGNAVPEVQQFVDFFRIISGKYDIGSTQSLVNPTQGLTISTLRDYLNVQSGFAVLPLIAGYYLQTQTSNSSSVSSSGQNELQQISSAATQALAIANNAARIAQAAQADVNNKFVMPVGGISRTMLATDVQTSLTKADNGVGGTSAVTSVNSKVGDVNLTAADISGLGTAATQQVSAFATATQGAKADTAIQSIPKAGTTTSGTVKIGSGIDLSPDSTISVTTSSIGAATAAQGAKADSALQVAPVTSVAGKNGIVQLTTADIGGLGSAASHSTADFASAAQGTKADNAVQIVNGKTGNSIDISAADIGALSQTTADGRYATIAQGVKADSAVQTINGKTGSTVTLNAADVGALTVSAADSRYVRTINGLTPDVNGNIEIAAGSGGPVTDYDGGTF